MTGGREERFGLGIAGAEDGRSRLEGEKGGVGGVVIGGTVSTGELSFANIAPGGLSTTEGRLTALSSFFGVGAGDGVSHCFAIFFSIKATRKTISNAINPNAI